MRVSISKTQNKSPLHKMRGALFSVGVASALINILYLTSSFFMLQVYDRVIPSRSIPTLVVLGLLALMFFAFQAVFDVLRSRMLVRIAGMIEEENSHSTIWGVLKSPIRPIVGGDGTRPIRDLDQIKLFLSGQGPAALFDLPWLPFYVFICFLFHAWIGYVAITGVVVLGLLALLSHLWTRSSTLVALEAGNVRQQFTQTVVQNTEIIQALGMTRRVIASWERHTADFRSKSRRAADISNGLSAISKVARIVLQSFALATGALLVIKGLASPGIIIAGSILTSRALAPLDAAIANWRNFVATLQSWNELMKFVAALPPQSERLALPKPTRELSVEHLSGGPPVGKGEQLRPSVLDACFRVASGSALGVIGPSASGKSTLARLLVGVWLPYRGSIRLDGSDFNKWIDSDIGPHIGYLPQSVELMNGTISENISRFELDAPADKVLAAANIAGVHELILKLPEGYETEIGPSGTFLSAGQRQRVALARALYGEPFIVVLDEPNSNLDSEGEYALDKAISSVRARGGIVIVVAHRPAALNAVDLVMMMDNGRISAFGTKEVVLNQVLRRRVNTVAQLKVVGETSENVTE